MLAVRLTLVEEVRALGDLSLGGGKVNAGLVDLSLEFGMLEFELLDTGLILGNGCLFVSGELIQGVNDVVSELSESIDDLSNDSLVREVLVEGELDQGVDHGALLDLVPLLLGDTSDGVLELLHLQHGGVVEGFQESESLIDGSSGLVVLTNLGLISLMLLLSDESLFSDHLAVVGLVVVDLLDCLLDLGSAGNEEVVDHVVHAGNVLLGILDVLLKGNDGAVVFVGTTLEINLELLDTVIEVLNEFLDGINELLNWALNLSVEREEVKEGASPLGGSEVLNAL